MTKSEIIDAKITANFEEKIKRASIYNIDIKHISYKLYLESYIFKRSSMLYILLHNNEIREGEIIKIK